MNEQPTTAKRRGRPPKKAARRVENAEDPASASEALDSTRDAPSYSVQEDVLIYTTNPTTRLIQATVEEPESDTEAEGNHRAATPSMSHRVVSAAQAAKDTVQDTLTSAMEQAQELPSKLPFGWPALLGLLLLTLLAGHGLSSMLRPHYKSDDVSYFSRSVDQANHRYHQLKDYVHKTEGKLKDTENRLKDALKQVNFLHSSHSDTAEHHSALQDQMHKLSTKVSQAAHVFGSKSKGWLPSGAHSDDSGTDSDNDEHSTNLPSFIGNPIRELIQQQLETFAADKTGIPDWALLYAGGQVVGHSKPYKAAEPPLTDWAYWGCYLWPGCHAVTPRANKALLTPKVAPGQCFPLDGNSGWVDIQLHHPIQLTGFTIEHIPSSIAYNVSSAPNTVSLVGLTPPLTHLTKGGTFTPGKVHGPFKYDVDSSSAVQTFSIFSTEPEPVQHVRLQVHSNHGHPEFTCLYRLRVHGEPIY